MDAAMERVMFTVRTDRSTKNAFGELCGHIGISVSSAINAFIRQAVRQQYSGPHVKDQKMAKERFGQKCKRPNHNPYISRGVIFPGNDVWGRSSL